VVKQVLEECQEMPIARIDALRPMVDKLSAIDDLHLVVHCSVSSAIREFIRGKINQETLTAWQGTPWASHWFASVASWDLINLLTRQMRTSDDWARAWQWLAIAPRTLYERSPSAFPEILRTIFSSSSSYWNDATSRHWSSVLIRSRELSGTSPHLRACADSLQYAFKYTWLPLSSVVVEAFGDVYDAVAQSPSVPDEVSGLFGVFDWDKAKELRRSLVDSFYESSAWRPGDLALSARTDFMLRKVFKRLKRKWNGDRFIQAMIDDLGSRGGDRCMTLQASLIGMNNTPGFYEPWD
jgi:hypothetical protein